MASPSEALRFGLVGIYESGDYSDFTITCGPYHFKVHKAVLASQSEYFKTVFKSNRFKEGIEGTIDLKPDSDFDGEGFEDPDMIKLMVEYFYHLDYLPDHDSGVPRKFKTVNPNNGFNQNQCGYCHIDVCNNQPSELKQRITQVKTGANKKAYMLHHAKLFALAVKYEVPALRNLAADKFQNAISYLYNHESLGQVITLVYSSTADNVEQLRDIVAAALHENEKLLDEPEIEAAICSINALAYRLLKMSRAA